MVKTDCRYFPLDRPCALHKEKGTHCSECAQYSSFFASHPVKKILIIKLGAMGDVLRTTFLLPGLKEKYPQSEITWIVAPQSTAILDTNPHLARVWPYDRDTLSKLPLEKFDISINLDLAPESLALATAAFSDKKIGYWLDSRRRVKHSNTAARQWLQMSAFDDIKRKNDKTYQHWMAKITELPRADYEIYTPLTKDALKKAAQFKKSHALEKACVVGINPGAGKRWRLKKWTDAGYIKTINKLHASGKKVLLLGGPEESELFAYLTKKLGDKVINTGTANSLTDFFALLNLCHVLLAGDTLALHAALGLKKNVVAVFGPTSAPEIELYGRGRKVVSPAPCVCCYRTSCTVKPDCMQQISPEMVWNALETFF